MLDKLRPRSIYDVMAAIACFGVLAGGTAYAADTIGSSDVIDESLLSQDLKNGEVKNADIGGNQVTTTKIKAGNVATSDLADGAVTTEKVPDFGLSNQDVGVLFAQVNPDGSIANASGKYTGTRVEEGSYVIHFGGRDVSNCATIAADGDWAGYGVGVGTFGAVRKFADPDAVVAYLTDVNAYPVDRAFQLVVVC